MHYAKHWGDSAIAQSFGVGTGLKYSLHQCPAVCSLQTTKPLLYSVPSSVKRGKRMHLLYCFVVRMKWDVVYKTLSTVPIV